jgi:hypothetical protein
MVPPVWLFNSLCDRVLRCTEICVIVARNGGHCRPDCYRGYRRYKELFGKEEALHIIRNEMVLGILYFPTRSPARLT